MSNTKFKWLKKHWHQIAWLVFFVAVGVGGWFTQDKWMPHAKNFMAFIQNTKDKADKDEHEDDAPAAASDTLTLSPVAWKNIGLVTGSVESRDFAKVIAVPAVVVERPGRSQIEIAAPLTGIVTRVYPVEREAIKPGDPLFDLRLTRESSDSAQSDFLTLLQGLDVINKELKRLSRIGEGVIPGKWVIEQEYKRAEATAKLEALRQSLLLHGLTEEQVANIEAKREVLRQITVVAPPFGANHEHEGNGHQYHVQHINVNRGQNVASGELLSILADHCLLYVEGKAFEDDAERLMMTSQQGLTVQVVPVTGDYSADDVLNLKFQSVNDQVDMQSRALKFYLLLPNVRMGKTTVNDDDDAEFIAWKYRPGQRMEAKIPTSAIMKNKIVLPSEAVVVDGPNAFVFEQNGNNFDRVDVGVLYRDKDTIVLENDGQLVGSVIAMNGAYQMHLALKNQSGGAIDPHAGHNH